METLDPAAWVVNPETGCWEWQRTRSSLGYGRIKRGGTVHGAYRYVYEQIKGPVPDDLDLDHLCRNPACVNPDHLEPVTHAENVRRGNASKLSSADVRTIRESQEPHPVMAARFSVSAAAISYIRLGDTWADVGGVRPRSWYRRDPGSRAKRRDERRERIAQLWGRGLRLKEIAAALDSTPNAIGTELAAMRKAGWDVPPRRAAYVAR